MDVTCDEVDLKLTKKFGQTNEGKWLEGNSYRFGFIIRYLKGKEDITGYTYEPWHVRYVGKEVAEYIYINNITLEEFFTQKSKWVKNISINNWSKGTVNYGAFFYYYKKDYNFWVIT